MVPSIDVLGTQIQHSRMRNLKPIIESIAEKEMVNYDYGYSLTDMGMGI